MTTNKPASIPVLSFDDWLKDNDAYVLQQFQDMGHQIDCDECNGTGLIDLDDTDDYRFRQHMREIYHEQA